MSYRCLMIVNPARIRCKNEQLLIETEEVHSVPIEDISAIVLESRQSTITTAAMAALAHGIDPAGKKADVAAGRDSKNSKPSGVPCTLRQNTGGGVSIRACQGCDERRQR